MEEVKKIPVTRTEQLHLSVGWDKQKGCLR